MDSSNNSCNYNNLSNFLENDIINNSSTSKELDDPCSYPSLFTFPNSPQYSNMEYLHQIYHHLLSDPTNTENNPPEENPTKPAPRSIRSSKKDRHSKINTARGPRDRRMRLSLDVARKFFDLQDMLGYDKASRTVEWLLKNSSPAISDLERGRNMSYGSSNYSESCDQEVVSSGLDNLSGVWVNGSGGKNEEQQQQQQGSNAKQQQQQQMKKKVKKKGRKVAAPPRPIIVVEKESRKKARERARVRASQKRRLTDQQQHKQCAAAAAAETHYYDQEERFVVKTSRERDDFFGNPMSFQLPWNYYPSTSTALNPPPPRHNGNGISHPHHLEEFQFCGKLWEAQNSCN